LSYVENLTGTLSSLALLLYPYLSVLTLSGTPSAMMAMDLIWGYSISSIVDVYTLRDDAKLTTVSTSLCLAIAFSTDW